MKKYGFFSFLVICLFLISASVFASDLDDGISKSLDESISKDDELGQKDRNISFIKLKAKSDAAVRSKKGTDQGSAAGNTPATGNMNSVVLGPGGNVRGDIIIIDQSRGDKTQVVE
ncbi:MAG: hypothetical protein PHN84_08230 [Desulfuromonadaceae bacterium]|nr:hypothetical protein [Desulfuromonadaceae bacterium]MDD2856526.1 hypothetical protein [Desulfuromonadaceae bacterium]